jgi:hypothetical protein
MTMFNVDSMVTTCTAAEADALVQMVASLFCIRVLGEPEDHLGIEILGDRVAGTITIGQQHKAAALTLALEVAGER